MTEQHVDRAKGTILTAAIYNEDHRRHSNNAARIYSTKSEVESANVPASIDTVELRGFSTEGDGGGALYKKVASEPAHDLKIQSNDGAWWEELFAVDVTINIPSDFATLQDAINRLSKQPVRQGQNIILNIESGHALTAGVTVKDGDYSHFIIKASDATVLLDAAFPAEDSIVHATNARAPTLGCLVDCETTKAANGYFIYKNSFGRVLPSCGVKNVGGTGTADVKGMGCVVLEGSAVVARKGSGATGVVFTGSADRNLLVSKGSFIEAEGGDFSGALGDRCVFISRGSVAHLSRGTISNGAGAGIIMYRSRLVAMGATISNNTGDGVNVGQASIASLNERSGVVTTIEDNGGYGVLASAGAVVDLEQASVRNNTSANIRAQKASTVTAELVVATGSSSNNIEAANGSIVNVTSGTLTGAGASGIRAEHSNVVANSADLSNAADEGVFANNSVVSLESATINGTGLHAIEALQGSRISAASANMANNVADAMVEAWDGSIVSLVSATITNAAVHGVRSLYGSTISIRDGSVTGTVSGDDLRVGNGGIMYAGGCTTSSGGTPTLGDTNVSSFNAISSDGILFA